MCKFMQDVTIPQQDFNSVCVLYIDLPTILSGNRLTLMKKFGRKRQGSGMILIRINVIQIHLLLLRICVAFQFKLVLLLVPSFASHSVMCNV